VENSHKSVCGRGSAPDPAGGAHDAPPDPLIGWAGGNPLPRPHPPRRLRRLASRCLRHLELGAFGASPLGAFVTSNLATPQFFLFPPNLGCLDKTLVDNSESTATSNPSGTTDAVFTKLPRPLAKDRKYTLANWRPI